jgi:uncharacterized protein YehS (DUF1456 family)
LQRTLTGHRFRIAHPELAALTAEVGQQDFRNPTARR